MTFSDIIKTKADLEDAGYGIENNIIESIDVNTIAHFGDCVCLEIVCSDICPMPSYNSTRNIGYIIRAIVQLLGKSREDGIRLSELKNIPCRLVFKSKNIWGSKAIGIGHFMQDKFVLFEDLAQINK